MKEKNLFLNLKVPVFLNKKNGQISISLPKKQIKNFIKGNDVPKKLNIMLKLAKD